MAPDGGLLVYFFSRGLTDELGLPVHFTMPIRVDEWLGGGSTPTERLQDGLCGDPCRRHAARGTGTTSCFTTVYPSHFLAGLTVAAVLWVRNRAEWVRWMRRYVTHQLRRAGRLHRLPDGAAVDGGRGRLPPRTTSHRITGRGWADLSTGHASTWSARVGNPVAAMPSLHAGIAFLIAIYGIQRLRVPRWRWLLLLYPLAMSTALVYYGEHYVVDVLAGGLLAAVVLLGCQLWEAGRGDPPVTDRRERLSPPSPSPRG